jgi:hypothetical protein
MRKTTLLRDGRALLAALFFAAVATAACGPSLQEVQAREACVHDCNLGHMTCLESGTCVDMDGQQVPCEEDCARKQADCEDGCPGG